MTRNQWTDELKKYLITLPPDDLSRVLEYYNEIYNDKNEAGIGEKDILFSFGNPSDAAKKILADYKHAADNIAESGKTAEYGFGETKDYDSASLNQKPNPTHKYARKKIPVWTIPLIILGAVLIIGPALGIAAGFFGIFIAVWVVVGSLFISGIAMALGGFAGAAYSVYSMFVTFGIGLPQFGAALAVCGLGILMMLIMIAVLKLWLRANLVIFRLLVRLVTFGRVKLGEKKQPCENS